MNKKIFPVVGLLVVVVVILAFLIVFVNTTTRVPSVQEDAVDTSLTQPQPANTQPITSTDKRIIIDDLIPDDQIKNYLVFNGDFDLVTDPEQLIEAGVLNLIAGIHKEYWMKNGGADINVGIYQFSDSNFNRNLAFRQLSRRGSNQTIKQSFSIKSQPIDAYFENTDLDFNDPAVYTWSYNEYFFAISDNNRGKMEGSHPGQDIAENIINKYLK